MDREQRQQQQNQNQNRRRANRVRGPTSALSSFLQEHGIQVENRSRQAMRQRRQEQERTENVAERSSAEVTTQRQETTGILYMPATPTTATTTTRRRTRSAAAEQVITRASTGNKRKKCKNDSDYDDDDEDFNDAGTSSSRRPPAPRTRIAFCTKCNNRFSRLLNQKQDSNTAQLCPSCRSGSSTAAGAKTSRKPAARKRRVGTVPGSDGTGQVIALRDICINVIAKYIEEVEDFGEIGPDNLDKIAKIICRNRKLNNQTVRLFLGPMIKELSLYDCAYVDKDALMNIAHFCFNLERLKLVYCGHMTSEVLEMYGARLQQLRSVELSGPYLVLENAWINFIKSLGSRLDRFALSHCFRFTATCMEALAEHCPNLEALEFSHVNKMSDDWLDIIGRFEKLKVLKLAWPAEGQSITSESIIRLLAKVGDHLTELSLPGCNEVDDDVLLKGILEHCPRLKVLSLEDCGAISSEGIGNLFSKWKLAHPTSGLERLSVSRCLRLEDAAIEAILAHSSRTLIYLNLHSVDQLTAGGLEMIAGKYKDKEGEPCKHLELLDVSFVRAMDDIVLKQLSVNCPELKRLEVWGCHQLTDQVILPPTLRIRGRESNA